MSERTTEEWSRVAVGLPGWRWMPGMRVRNGDVRQWGTLTAVHPDGHVDYWDPEFEEHFTGKHPSWLDIDPDDPATAGCLLALLGPYACSLHDAEGWMAGVGSPAGAKFRVTHSGSSLGRACIAAAEAIGRWPGGDL
mgnify:CR=1 FL=1